MDIGLFLLAKPGFQSSGWRPGSPFPTTSKHKHLPQSHTIIDLLLTANVVFLPRIKQCSILSTQGEASSYGPVHTKVYETE